MGELLIFQTREEGHTWAEAFQKFAGVESEERARELADSVVFAMRAREGAPREGWKARALALEQENKMLLAANEGWRQKTEGDPEGSSHPMLPERK